MVIGSICLLRIQSKLRPATILLVGLGLFGTGTLLTGIAPTLGFALFFQGMSAFGNSFENVGIDTVIQQTVPHQMLGRVFGTLYSGMQLASSIAYMTGGPFMNFVSARSVFIFSGIGVLISMLFASRALLHNTECVHKGAGYKL
jgi:MFS family permease